MSSINQIRQDLIVAQEELHEDLAAVERALQALGKPEEEKPQAKKRARKQTPPSPRLLKASEKALRSAERPMTTAEVAKHTKVSPSATVRALRHLERAGTIKVSGHAPGKGRIPLWEIEKTEAKPEMEPALAPAQREGEEDRFAWQR